MWPYSQPFEDNVYDFFTVSDELFYSRPNAAQMMTVNVYRWLTSSSRWRHSDSYDRLNKQVLSRPTL